MAIRDHARVLGIVAVVAFVTGCTHRHNLAPKVLGWSNHSRACAEKLNDDGGIDSTDARENLSTCYEGTGALVGIELKL